MRLKTMIIAALFSTAAIAQDFPGYGGVLQSQTDATVVTWQCQPPAEGSPLTCQFADTSVVHPPLLDLEAEVKEMLDPAFQAECDEIGGMRTQLTTAIGEARGKGLMDDVQVGIVEGYIDGIEKVCTDPTRESVAAYVDMQNDTTSRTCRVSTSMREETFEWNASSTRWESISPPTGPCGQINIVAMEKADELFWSLRRQSIVTNRTGTMPLGEACSSVEEKNDVYEWRTHDLNLGCQFIKFGY